MLITELLHIQFHKQFLVTYSGFWLVNILLQLFDISSQKRNEKEKNTFLLPKNKKKCYVKKVYVNIKHSVNWGINIPLQNHHLFLAMPPLNRQTVQAPLLRKSLPSILIFCEHSPKSRIFLWILKILKFFIPYTILSFKSN